MAMLLSTLYVVCDRLSLKAGAEAAARGAKLLQHLELVTGSPFAALAFRTLLHGKRIAALEKAALAAAMFGLIKRLTAHLAPTDDARRSERAFEHTRAALYYLLAIPAPQKEGESGAAAGSFSNISLQCDVSGSRLADPVRVVIKIAEGEEGGGPQEPESGGDERRILSRAKAEELIAEGDAAALTKLGLPAGTDVTNAVSLEPDPLHAALLLATPFLSSVNIWQAPPAAVDRSLVRAPAPLSEFDFSTLANMAGKQAELAVFRPRALSRAAPPVLTLGMLESLPFALLLLIHLQYLLSQTIATGGTASPAAGPPAHTHPRPRRRAAGPGWPCRSGASSPRRRQRRGTHRRACRRAPVQVHSEGMNETTIQQCLAVPFTRTRKAWMALHLRDERAEAQRDVPPELPLRHRLQRHGLNLREGQEEALVHGAQGLVLRLLVREEPQEELQQGEGAGAPVPADQAVVGWGVGCVEPAVGVWPID